METGLRESDQVKSLDERVDVIEEDTKRQNLYSKYEMMQEEWVKSKTHIFFVATTTYAFVALFMYFLGVTNVLINALIPAGAYVVSQMSVPFIKKAWIKQYLRSESDKVEKLEGNKPNPVFQKQTEPMPDNPHAVGRTTEQASLEEVVQQPQAKPVNPPARVS